MRGLVSGESPILDGRAVAGRKEDDMEGRSGRSQPLQLIPPDHEFKPQQQREAAEDRGANLIAEWSSPGPSFGWVRWRRAAMKRSEVTPDGRGQ